MKLLSIFTSSLLAAQSFVGSSTGAFSTAKCANPVYTPNSSYVGGPTSIVLSCAEPGCVICYNIDLPGVPNSPPPLVQTPGVCENPPTTLTYTTPIPAPTNIGIVAVVTAPGYANSNTTASVFAGVSASAANVNPFLNTLFAPGTGAASTIVAPPTGTSNCNAMPTNTKVNYALIALATAVTGSAPSFVNDNIQMSAVNYTGLGTPASTGTSRMQFYGSTLSPNNPTIMWAVGTPDQPNGTAICISGYTAVDGTPTTVQNSSASSFTLPSLTPTLGAEMFVAACTDESTTVALTTASTGWSAVTGTNAVSGQSMGFWLAYRVKALGDTSPESPVFTSASNIGASCMMVALK